MKLRFKHQKFQADAAKAVVDVFTGQPYLTPSYMMDKGCGYYQHSITEESDFTGWYNARLIPKLDDELILEHIQNIQKNNQIAPSPQLEGRYNLTVEMETGVGKTYTYIKTIYELNKHYGWSKYIIVVPSIAIREGVYKSFQVTQEHFAEEYGKKIRFFIYNSARLAEIDRFASDSSINVMIINSQAFNAKGKDTRRIYMKLDEFRSHRPIDIIAKTNPILIIDEPQSVEGKQTKARLKEFHPLMTLRYSATHKSDQFYNMVYRLDAVEAYNKRLVKKIAVKGITEAGSTATESYVYLEGINLSKADPTATLHFDFKGASGIRKKSMKAGIGFNLYDSSGQLEEYKNGFVVKSINGLDDSVEFLNGIKLYSGDVIGKVSEEQIRRIQIRETIFSHIERERELFYKGIKVLSLFFVDEVAKYRQYDETGQPINGIYADIFEEEYQDIIDNIQGISGEADYLEYLHSIAAENTHAGYFSVDKKGKMIDSKVSRRETASDDIDAYDLIMKNKELLLNRDPKISPVRFIFSHSALREGWDNPNVFQICTLKQSSSDVRKRQEVGRGLRLCVNQDGERMDANILGKDVHNVNVLTVIASESYDSFAKGLQAELAEDVGNYLKMDIDHSESDISVMYPEDARSNNVQLQMDLEKLEMPEFEALWSKINAKSVYTVDFDTDELVKNAVTALNTKLHVPKIYVQVETGEMDEIRSKEELLSGEAFVKKISVSHAVTTKTEEHSHVKYDLIGKIVNETGLTRKTIVQIMTGIKKSVFEQFQDNPEEFIIKAASLINDEKTARIIEHITYHALEETYDTNVLTDSILKGKLGVNVMKTNKHLYDHLVYDSIHEKEFAENLDICSDVAVYVKLPKRFYIATPVGRYTPDWAIAFYEGNVKYIYFVAETKASMKSVQLRQIEQAKIRCAKEHFKAISGEKVVYDVIDSYQTLMDIVLK